jgi:alanine-glyoxylate transaminase/serine-glyoxylate transaminase/serine-pyruvate transaminase
MGLELADVPHEKGGVAAAMIYLAETARPAKAKAA